MPDHVHDGLDNRTLTVLVPVPRNSFDHKCLQSNSYLALMKSSCAYSYEYSYGMAPTRAPMSRPARLRDTSHMYPVLVRVRCGGDDRVPLVLVVTTSYSYYANSKHKLPTPNRTSR
eukprot:scaffold93395_cov17-Prasinocladus_malaysianus.AAC.1